MPTPRVDAEKVRKIRELKRQGRSIREIMEEVPGVSHGAVHKYSKYVGDDADMRTGRLSSSLDPVDMPIDLRGKDEGETRVTTLDRPRTLDEMAQLFGIDTKEWVPEVVRTNEWQGFYKSGKIWQAPKYDSPGSMKTDHQKVSLWQTRVVWRRVIKSRLEEGLKEFLAKTVKPIPALKGLGRRNPDENYLVTWGLWDAHLGMYAWADEVGENFDLDVATNRVMNSIDDMTVELSRYGIRKILMPVGNDFMHFDNAQQRTTSNMHQLDTDTRFAKVYAACLRCLAHMVERALEVADEVEVLYVPGNHDEMTSFTMCVALQQRYRGNSRVKVDVGANPRKHRLHGGVLLGFAHGKDCKPEKLAQILSTECLAQWSSTTYREVQVGHTHQKREQQFESLTPTNGVTVVTNPSLCNADAWHHRNGFIGDPVKSVEARRFDTTGFRGSHCVWARDQSNPASSRPCA